MALIKCPECGKENVSSYASVCPDCGFPITEHVAATESKDKLKGNTTFYWSNFELSPMQFDNGLLDGVSGVHSFGHSAKYNYRVENNKLYVNIYGTEKLWTLTPDYILENESKLSGNVIDTNSLSGTFSHPTVSNHPELGTDYYTFFADGRYSEVRIQNSYSGLFLHENDLVVVYVRNNPQCFVIYDGSIYSMAYIAPHRLEEVKTLYKKIRELAETNLQAKSVKCPYCRSTFTKKIGSMNRAVSFGFLGFGSSKIGKQWHCNSCCSDF